MLIKPKINVKAYPDMSFIEKIIYRISLKIFFIKNKKYIKKDIEYAKFREENPISFNLKEYLNNHFNEVYYNECTNNN